MATRTCLLCLLAAVALTACRSEPTPPLALEGHAAAAVQPERPVRVLAAGSVAPAAAAQDAPVAAVLEPAVLARLQAEGFGLGALVTGVDAHTTRALARETSLGSVLAVLGEDLDEVAEANPKAKVSTVEGRRRFDAAWLDSDALSFELIGVFNRLDRRVFAPGHCGEVRFVYRLRYDVEQGGAPMSGRLPMTVNVVFHEAAPDPARDCADVAAAWHRAVGSAAADDTEATLAWLGAGPLSAARRAHWQLLAVETSLQTIRWQSTVHPSLAGHVEYLLRVFHPTDAGAFAPVPLENTPDVEALRDSRVLREALREHLAQPETLAALDRGTLVLPERFLATRALATSPRGLARLANRPFRQLFDPEESFGELELSGYQTIGSPAALVRRLDGLTCQGCHQSHSVGGFHHLGRESELAPLPGLLTGSSAHLLADLERRAAYTGALRTPGAAPDELRPPAELQGQGGGAGAPCGLGDAGFARWTCADGLVCTPLEDTELGTCAVPAAAGTACEVGTMRSRARPDADRVKDLGPLACDEAGHCLDNEGGWPQGACTGACEPGEPGCGLVTDIDTLQACLRDGGGLERCAAESLWLTALQPCDARSPCRGDYVCVDTAGSADGADGGACVPPYFVYQLRLDGLPLGP